MQNVKKSTKFNTFHIIRHRNQPERGQLPDGTWVYKTDKFWVSADGMYIGLHPRQDGEPGRYIPAAPYDNHFLYLVPPKYPGSAIRCSCGGAGIISGYSGYVLDASLQGQLVICMVHSNTGYHSVGESRWV